jgi:hypothetical protein
MENQAIFPAANAIQNLGQRQIMLSLSYLAYCGEQITTPDPESTILELINNAIPQIPPITNWTLVWGPVTYTTPGSLYQDNLMFVAKNKSNPTQYAVAVRSTNSISDLDWLMEDFDIMQQIPWSPNTLINPIKDAQISESISIGLQILFSMKDSTTTTTLLDYLTSVSTTAINLCITGHSLGGCLAGTLALYLKENVALWDQSGKSNLSAITFAAPTAGNAAFAAYSDAQFSGQPIPPNWDARLGTTFDAVRNPLDVAPLCWIADNISTEADSGNTISPIFSLYVVPNDYDNKEPEIDFTEMKFVDYIFWTEVILPYLLPAISSEIAGLKYTQVVATAQQLPNSSINNSFTIYDSDLEATLNMFIQQATYQHSQSYPVLLRVPVLNSPNVIVLNPFQELSLLQSRSIPHLRLALKLVSSIAKANILPKA